MRIQPPHNPKPMTDLGRTLSKNLVYGLVRSAQKLAKSMTETNSKVQERKTYDETINNFIYRNR